MASMNGGVVPMEQGHIRGAPSQTSIKSPTSMGAGFFQFFQGGGGGAAAQKKTTRDSQPAKRRGPKPDTKPALTRRQELNRQAQRTHRERKEQYIRSLETEVSRLREAYTQEISAANLAVVQHREMVQSLTAENAILKELLSAHGISYEGELERRKAERGRFQSSPFATSSVGSQTARVPTSNGTYSTPPTTGSADSSPHANGADRIDISHSHDHSPPSVPTQTFSTTSWDTHGALDLSAIARNIEPVPAIGGVFENDPQLQIDFILTLESPCREHTDYLCRRSITEADDEDMPFSGHALMATCPPPSYIAGTTNEQIYPHKTYDLPPANLATLLNLSRQLVTDGQITPIMALQCLKNHELYRTLTKDNVKVIVETLNTKVRCYGFGAVIEDFELRDCFHSVLGPKGETGVSRIRDDMIY